MLGCHELRYCELRFWLLWTEVLGTGTMDFCTMNLGPRDLGTMNFDPGEFGTVDIGTEDLGIMNTVTKT